jgi:ubiquinone/menaquinone biosynthesis C-methylase UbiE
MRTAVREVFALAAAAYGRGNPLLRVEREETQALLPGLAGVDALDVGCGTGHYAAHARAGGARLAVALDLTLEMLRRAPAPAVLADGARLPLRDESFDVVVAALALSYLDAPRRGLAEIARVLRKGGTLVLSDLHEAAIARGWRRSFAAPSGEALAIAAPPLTSEALARGLAEAGLTVEARREVTVDARLEPEFRHAGRRDFATLFGTPLLVVLRARKGEPDAR